MIDFVGTLDDRSTFGRLNSPVVSNGLVLASKVIARLGGPLSLCLQFLNLKKVCNRLLRIDKQVLHSEVDHLLNVSLVLQLLLL